VAEFLAQPKGTWCKITATLSNLKSDVYGNFDLVDETGSVYVYGLTTSFVAKNDKSFANLGLKEGDIVTLVGKRDSYNDQDQVGGPAYYISHEEGAPAVDVWAGENVVTYEMPEFMFTDYPQYCSLTEIKAYADETNLYARLKTTKTSGVAKLRLCTADTNEGTETVWYWEKSFYSTPVYKSDKVSVDADFNFSLSYNGTPVALNTVVDGDVVYWEMTIPRAAHDHTKAAGSVNLGFVAYDANGSENGLMPKVWGEMLKVTLP
jgi:RPA family protein